MTKPISRKMAVDCLLYRFERDCVTFGDNNAIMACGICRLTIAPGQNIQFDHIHAIVHQGPHEYQNLRPVHAECHKAKTKADIQANAKVKRILADKPSKRPMQKSSRKIPSRPFPQRAST